MNIIKPYYQVAIVNNMKQVSEIISETIGSIIALEITNADQSIKNDLLNFVNEKNVPFLILIDEEIKSFEKNATREIIDYIIFSMFSKNYVRINDIPVIAFTNQQNTVADIESEKTFISSFTAQGWPMLHMWHLPVSMSFKQQILQQKTQSLFLDTIDADEEFLLHQFFSDPQQLGKYIFFSAEVNYKKIENDLFSIYKSIIKKNSFLTGFIAHCTELKTNNSQLNQQVKVLSEKLNNAETTIEIIRSKYKDDYELLFNWYHKEYEVLPLWYKRFGHIIKVIIGKRSFKSLFTNENV
jgi:hypothetical protein